MSRARSAALAASLLCLLSGGCQPTSSATPSLGRRTWPMFYGSADTAPAHAAVVALVERSSGYYFCSGTLITSTVVLTAAHCLDGMSAADLQVLFGDDAYADNPTLVDVSEALAHPAYTGDADDLGLLRLASPVSVPPIPPLPASLALTSDDVGTDMDFSGFGLTETGVDGSKLHFVAPIGLVCPGPASCAYLSEYVAPRAVAYTQAAGGPCSGDSGGPGFVVRDGQEYVASVTSYGDLDCTIYGVSGLVSSYQDFIDTFVGFTDAGLPAVDAGAATPGEDAGAVDAAAGAPDASAPDAALPAPDAASPGPDAGAADADLALPPDAAAAGPDASTAGLDAQAPVGPDAAAVPGPDASAPSAADVGGAAADSGSPAPSEEGGCGCNAGGAGAGALGWAWASLSFLALHGRPRRRLLEK